MTWSFSIAVLVIILEIGRAVRKYQRYISRINASGYVAPVAAAIGEAKQSKWLNGFSIAASLSQVVMVFVVVFGYVYTVRPVFQKEVISEDLARLQLEQRAWGRQIEEQKSQLKIGEQKNTLLEKERIELVSSLAKLKEAHEFAIEEAKAASKQAQAAIDRASSLDKSFKEAVARQIAFRKSELTGSGKVASPWVQAMKRPYVGDFFSYDRRMEVSVNLKKVQLQPIKAAEGVLDELRAGLSSASSASSKIVEQELLSTYEKGLKKNANLLVCPAPNFDAWQVSFLKAMERVDVFRGECVDHLFQKQVLAQSWSQEIADQVRKSNEWKTTLEQFGGMCVISLRYGMTRLFNHAWDVADDPCKIRYMSASAIVLGENGGNLPPLQEFIPPTIGDIDNALSLTINNW
jgi:hypothetical protein